MADGDPEAVVMLLHDDGGNPYVVISDMPNAATTVGAQHLRIFPEGADWTWPKEAVEYASELSKGAANCAIEYETWVDFGDEEEL